jgi:acetyltransferase-like isoleucine patch superfamily enzyme
LIHNTAVVNPKAKIAANVEIGPFSIIHAGVTILSGSIIGSHCEIGIQSPLAKNPELVIGQNSIIRSHSIFYIGSKFGKNLTTGHHVTVRENTIAGENLQIGTLSDIQGDSVFGSFVRLHSNVHIGKASQIGDFVWIFPYVVLTNDPHPPSETLIGVTVEKFAVIATMSTILPGLTIGEGSLIGAHTLVSKNVDANVIVVGVPGKEIGSTSRIKLTGSGAKSAYPWRNHFHRGYPDEVIQGWITDAESN